MKSIITNNQTQNQNNQSQITDAQQNQFVLDCLNHNLQIPKYESLRDKHLESFFDNKKIKHLQKMGLVIQRNPFFKIQLGPSNQNDHRIVQEHNNFFGAHPDHLQNLDQLNKINYLQKKEDRKLNNENRLDSINSLRKGLASRQRINSLNNQATHLNVQSNSRQKLPYEAPQTLLLPLDLRAIKKNNVIQITRKKDQSAALTSRGKDIPPYQKNRYTPYNPMEGVNPLSSDELKDIIQKYQGKYSNNESINTTRQRKSIQKQEDFLDRDIKINDNSLQMNSKSQGDSHSPVTNRNPQNNAHVNNHYNKNPDMNSSRLQDRLAENKISKQDENRKNVSMFNEIPRESNRNNDHSPAKPQFLIGKVQQRVRAVSQRSQTQFFSEQHEENKGDFVSFKQKQEEQRFNSSQGPRRYEISKIENQYKDIKPRYNENLEQGGQIPPTAILRAQNPKSARIERNNNENSPQQPLDPKTKELMQITNGENFILKNQNIPQIKRQEIQKAEQSPQPPHLLVESSQQQKNDNYSKPPGPGNATQINSQQQIQNQNNLQSKQQPLQINLYQIDESFEQNQSQNSTEKPITTIKSKPVQHTIHLPNPYKKENQSDNNNNKSKLSESYDMNTFQDSQSISENKSQVNQDQGQDKKANLNESIQDETKSVHKTIQNQSLIKVEEEYADDFEK